MRYFVKFTYNGTPFHGSQMQPNGITVQGTMEDAFSTILRQPIFLTFAGRTDAGVHALEMYAHFDYFSPLNSKLITAKLNSLLPPEIAVYDILPVHDEAHARFAALSRTYEYRVTDHKNPFNIHLMTEVAPGLNYDIMNEAAQLLIGTHDFASFCKVHTDVKTTICTVTEAYWQPVLEKSSCIVPLPESSEAQSSTDMVFTITANRFLRNMVRAIVGTLFAVGSGKLSIADFQAIIDAKNRCAAGQSAPSDGLYLVHIEYPQNIV